jgi:hypothetical protein
LTNGSPSPAGRLLLRGVTQSMRCWHPNTPYRNAGQRKIANGLKADASPRAFAMCAWRVRDDRNTHHHIGAHVLSRESLRVILRNRSARWRRNSVVKAHTTFAAQLLSAHFRVHTG